MPFFFILKVPLGSNKNVPYIGFTSPTRFNKKFSELNSTITIISQLAANYIH